MSWTFVSIYMALAILVSVGGAVSVFMLALNRRIAPELLFFFVVATASALSFYFGHRDLNLMSAAADFSGNETWVSRFANLAALGLCLVALVQIGISGPVSGTAVIVASAALQYYFVCFLMPVSFDRWFVFDHRQLYPVAALMIVIMPSTLSTRQLATNFARATAIPAALSLLLLAVSYKTAVLESYQSLLPFFKGRLYGATSHPNVLGSMAAFGILLVTSYPPTRRWETIAIIFVDGAALLLSQSKTSWLTLLLCLGIVHFPRLRQFRGRVPAWVVVGVFLVLAAVPAVASLLNKSIYDYWAGNQNISQIGTLTGRTDIWRATLYLVSRQLVTGPGYATFLIEMKALFPSLVANTHNLYLDTLVRAGIVGVTSLALQLAVVIIAAARLNGRERLFALAYISLVCLRGLSEAFLYQDAFTSPLFWQWLMFLRFVAVASRPGGSQVSLTGFQSQSLRYGARQAAVLR